MSPVETRGTKQEIGAPVTHFGLDTIEGGTINLQGLLQGKKGAIIVFWSAICSHCVLYDEYLSSFAQRHPELGLVAIASRHGETSEQIRAVVADRKLTFPILHDPGGKVAEQWSTQQTPRAFLIDSKSVLLYRGAIDNYKYPGDPDRILYLEPAIAEFLAGTSVTRTETASFGCAIKSVYYTLPKAL